MRGSFVRTLSQIAERDARVVLLTGDLGFTVVETFAEKHPTRFFNVGVAEQNMIGTATGLAEAGLLPFAYSIATFASLRAYEFIRNGPVLHDLPVRIVGVGGGLEYGPAGPTHHAVEDIGVLRLQPNLTVLAPADHQQAAAALEATWDSAHPIYYRLGKDDRATVPRLDGRFALGRAEQIREGTDIAIVTMGAIATEAAVAAERLQHQGIRCGVLVVASVSPAPLDDLAGILAAVPIVLTVEAHYVTGGLGSIVSEVVAELGLGCRVVRCGIRGSLAGDSGSERFLLERHGLSADGLVNTALRSLGRAAE